MSTKKTFKEKILSEEYKPLDSFIGGAMILLTLYLVTKWEWLEMLIYIIGCVVGLIWIFRQFYFILKVNPRPQKRKRKGLSE